MKYAIFDHMDGAAGSPRTVRDILSTQMAHAGLNYLASQPYFGDMSPDEASRSASLFAEHVADLGGTRTGTKQQQELEVMSPV